MSQQTTSNWLPLTDASRRAGVHYETLRRVVQAGVFSRRNLVPNRVKPRVYVRADEVDAWVDGGVDAVAKLRSRNRRGANP